MQNNEKNSLFANDVNAPVKVELHDNGQYFVSARELHAFLGVETKFTVWCERMFSTNFVKDRDYFQYYLSSPKNGTAKELEGLNLKQKAAMGIQVDYWLTIRCAQHMGMMQRNGKGEIIRDYFISCEDRLQQVQALIAQSAQQSVTSLRQDITSLRQDVDVLNRNMNVMLDNFNKATTYFKEMQEEIDDLKENQKSSTSQLDDTEKRVDKIEEHLDFKSIACVYVMFCPHRKLYKFGSSHDAKGRRKQFSVVYANLDIVYEIRLFRVMKPIRLKMH